MVYVRQYWSDYPDDSTPITAARLNHIEEGIFNFVAPPGDQGPPGPPGAPGSSITGPQGPNGDSGVYFAATGVTGTYSFAGMAFGDIRSITLTGSLSSITLPTPVAPKVGTLTIRVVQGGSGSYTIVWTGVKWNEGLPPLLPTGVNSVTFIHLTWTGAEWIGAYAGGNYA